MRKIAVLLSAIMLINMLPVTGLAFETDYDGVYSQDEDTNVYAIDEQEYSLEEECSEEENDSENENNSEEIVSEDGESNNEIDFNEDDEDDDNDENSNDDEDNEYNEDLYEDCLDDNSTYSNEEEEKQNEDYQVTTITDNDASDEQDIPEFESKGTWEVDLKYPSTVNGDNDVIIFDKAFITAPEDEKVYSITASISGGTISSTIPVITVDGETSIVIAASMNLTKTQCVYSFTLEGSPASISLQAAEEIVRSIIYNRSGSQDMDISIEIDGRYTVLPSGTNITAGSDEDGLGGHYYAYVSGSLAWTDAYTAARSMYYKGMQGYLVTVVRAEEDYILSEITTQQAWSGGARIRYTDGTKLNGENSVKSSDVSKSYNNYYWTAGPEGEVGYEYTLTTNYANGTSNEGAYNNWNTNEPNNSGSNEQYMQVFFSNYKWNDYPLSTSSIKGYFVEFGDVAVPVTGESNFYDESEESESQSGSASTSVEVPNVRVTFADDMVYDGQPLVDPAIIGGDDGATVKYYEMNADGSKGKELLENELIDAGYYLAEIDVIYTVVTQQFEITPKPIYFDWDGGPYVYNSLEHIPKATINNDYLVVRLGETEIDDCSILSTNTSLISTTVAESITRAGIDTGTHLIQVLTLSNSNYMVASDSGHYFEVTPKEIYAEFTNLTTVYNGGNQSPTITLTGVCSDKDGKSDNVWGSPNPLVINTGEYTITAVLSGGHANNYVLTEGITCIYTVNKMPVAFEILNTIVEVGTVPGIDPNTDNIQTTDDLNDRVSVNLDYTITYVDEKGNVYQGPSAPTIEGIYDVYIEITNQDLYRHEGSTTGDSIKVGSILVVENVETADYSKYSVTLTYDDGNEISTVTDVVDVLKGTIEYLQTPTKEGYTFVGWKYVNKMYSAGTSFEITKDCTLEAVWALNTDGAFAGGVGTGEPPELEPVAGATVTLWDGDTVIAEAVTDENGHYDFGFEVPDGIYNLKSEKDGKTVTSLVEVVDGVPNNTDIYMPKEGSNSIVTVAPGMTDVVVGGLDEVASQSEVDGTYRVTVDSEISDEFSQSVEGILKSNGVVVDVEITFDGIVLDSVDETLEVIVKLPIDMQGNSTYLVYIYDEETGEVIKLSTSPDENGNYYKVSSDRSYVTIYTSRTETFVVDTFSSSGVLAVTSKVQISDTDNGTLLSKKTTAVGGDVITITPSADEGYILGEIVVTDANGNSVAVTQNDDGSYSYIQPDNGSSVTGTFVEVGGNGIEGEDFIGVYNPDGTLESKIPTGTYGEIIITGVDGEVIARYPGSSGDIYLPSIGGLGEDEIVEGWYTATDEDGNLVFKPIITTPTSGEANMDEDSIGGGNDIDATGGGLDQLIDVEYDGEIVDRINPEGGGDIIVLGPDGEEIARIPAGTGTDKIELPSITLPDSQVVEGWATDIDPDGNIIYRPIIANSDEPYANVNDNVNDNEGNPKNENSDKSDKVPSKIDEDNDSKIPTNPNDRTQVPQTNDNITYAIWFVAMLASAFIIMLINRKKTS